MSRREETAWAVTPLGGVGDPAGEPVLVSARDEAHARDLGRRALRLLGVTCLSVSVRRATPAGLGCTPAGDVASTPSNAMARRAALLEAAALCDRMADEALEQSRFEYIDTYTVSCFEEAASWLVAARDRLRAMADEAGTGGAS